MKTVSSMARCVLSVASLAVVASLFLSACTTYVAPGPGPRYAHGPWVPGHYNRFGEWIPGHYR